MRRRAGNSFTLPATGAAAIGFGSGEGGVGVAVTELDAAGNGVGS